jgi:hypothetical protein
LNDFNVFHNDLIFLILFNKTNLPIIGY